MSRTVTAFFDTRAEAESARTRLNQSRIDADRVQIIDKNNSGPGAGSGGTSEDQGFWSSMKSAFMPEEDSVAYEEGMRRGGYLLCAQVDEDQADAAIRILDEGGSVDFDQRQEQWRTEGWNGQATAATGQRSQQVEEQRIPLVEEELRVGKREVARGGARVRSYVREVPVHEEVSLREEHVSVERRPVNQTLSAAELASGDLLRDRTIEMTETAEEAVVAKAAQVREEFVVKKTSEQHVERIDDTVRRTEVEVDQGMTGQDRSAFAFKEGTANASAGAGATGFESEREPERQDSGYTDRINKTGL